MSLPPIVYHHFRVPLPYARALQFQHAVYNLQHSRREGSLPYNDAIFLLEHRPVYTGGRRQTAAELELEQARLTKLGADFVLADRGGQLTYHGPGQLIGYPLLDLGRRTPAMGIRDYICHLQRALGSHLRDAHGLEAIESDNTGVFLDPTTKIASIGIQVRHRFTSHGFSLNVTHEPRSWFDEIVACGLPDVMAGSIASATGKEVSVAAEIPGILAQLSKRLEREVVPLGDVHDGELLSLVRDMEANAVQALEDKGSCPTAPEHH